MAIEFPPARRPGPEQLEELERAAHAVHDWARFRIGFRAIVTDEEWAQDAMQTVADRAQRAAEFSAELVERHALDSALELVSEAASRELAGLNHTDTELRKRKIQLVGLLAMNYEGQEAFGVLHASTARSGGEVPPVALSPDETLPPA